MTWPLGSAAGNRRPGGRGRDARGAAGAPGCDALVGATAGQRAGISFASVVRIWRDNDLNPWKRETFKFSTDPELDAKVRDVVGLYLNPPEKAVVVCVDEKTKIQALDRTAPILPLRPGLPEKVTSDHVQSRRRSPWAHPAAACATWPRHTPGHNPNRVPHQCCP